MSFRTFGLRLAHLRKLPHLRLRVARRLRRLLLLRFHRLLHHSRRDPRVNWKNSLKRLSGTMKTAISPKRVAGQLYRDLGWTGTRGKGERHVLCRTSLFISLPCQNIAKFAEEQSFARNHIHRAHSAKARVLSPKLKSSVIVLHRISWRQKEISCSMSMDGLMR